MFKVELTEYGQSLATDVVTLDGVILLYDKVEDVPHMNDDISSYTVDLDIEASGSIKNSIGNVLLHDLSANEYSAKTILFYQLLANGSKKILAGYAQDTSLIQKRSENLHIYLSFDFSDFTNGFLFSLIQSGCAPASQNTDGILHLENPDIAIDDQYSVYSKPQIDELLNTTDVELIRGTHTKSVAAWTGATHRSELFEGMKIKYFLPFAGVASSTLQLTLSDGSTTEALPMYFRGSTRVGTHFPAGSIIPMVYMENVTIGSTIIEKGWFADSCYADGNTTTYLSMAQPITAGPNGIYGRSLVMRVSEYEWESIVLSYSSTISKHITNTSGFYPDTIYYTSGTTTVTAGNVSSATLYETYSTLSYTTYFTAASATNPLIVGKPFYLVGSIHDDGKFYLKTGSTSSHYAQEITTDDIYLLIGIAYTTTATSLLPSHPMFTLRDGNIVEVTTQSLLNEEDIATLKSSIPTKTSDLTNDSNFVDSSSLSAIATSGSYNDLSDKPNIPSSVAELSDSSNYTLDSSLSAVAKSGSYTDLSNKPNIPSKVSDLTNDSGFITSASVPTKTSDLTNDSNFISSSELSSVATSGSYTDLSDTPDIPTKTSDITNDSGFITSTSLSGYALTSSLKEGAYLDVDDTATNSSSANLVTGKSVASYVSSQNFATTSQIPTVNNATLTIQKNGTSVGTFTANSNSNVTANIVVPTKTSDLTNDSNFVASTSLSIVATSGSYNDLSDKPTIPTALSALTNDVGYLTSFVETDPTVPSWAKQSKKPSYTANEVGALPDTTVIPSNISQLTNDSGFITSAAIPTEVSAFTNDAGYLTSFTETDPTVPSWAKQVNKPTYTAAEVGALPDSTKIPSKTSDITNDSGFITSADIPTNVSSFTNDAGYLTTHQSLANVIASAQYNSTNKRIEFYNSSSTKLTSYIDATTFIKDGMVSNVSVTDGNLVISFNTDADHEDIEIPISDIFNAANYYTSSETDTVISTAITSLSLGTASQKNASNDMNTDSNLPTTSAIKTYITNQNFATVSQIPTNNNELTNGAGYITSAALSGYTQSSSLGEGAYLDVDETSTTSSSTNLVTGKAMASYISSQSFATTTQLPVVNNAALTIQKNGTTIATFTSNASSPVTANITIPTKTSDLSNDSNFIASTSLSTVATSGSYEDLADLPTIPSTVAELSDSSNYTLDSSLSAVAKSGSYNDLSNKPSIPTNTNQLMNGAGFITVESDPTVPAWAKAESKPTYTANEVGALPNTTHIPTTVAELSDSSNYTLDSSLSTVAKSGSYNDLSNKPSIPSKVSDLTNDTGFITSSDLPTNHVTTDTEQEITGTKTISEDDLVINDEKIADYVYKHGQEFIVGTQTASTSLWKGITKQSALYEGMCINYFLPFTSTSTAATLELTLPDGSTTGAIPIRRNGGSTITSTHAGVGSVIQLTYLENRTIGSTEYAQVWKLNEWYDANTNYYDRYLIAGHMIADTGGIYGSQICLRTGENLYESICKSRSTAVTKKCNEHGFYLDSLLYYNSTTALTAGSTAAASTSYRSYPLDLRYSINQASSTIDAAVYLVCTYNSADHKFYLAETWWSQSLPTSKDGKYYVYLGIASSATAMNFEPIHPIFYHNGTCVIETNIANIEASFVTISLDEISRDDTESGYTLKFGPSNDPDGDNIELSLYPSEDDYCYIGTPSNRFYKMFAYDYYATNAVTTPVIRFSAEDNRSSLKYSTTSFSYDSLEFQKLCELHVILQPTDTNESAANDVSIVRSILELICGTTSFTIENRGMEVNYPEYILSNFPQDSLDKLKIGLPLGDIAIIEEIEYITRYSDMTVTNLTSSSSIIVSSSLVVPDTEYSVSLGCKDNTFDNVYTDTLTTDCINTSHSSLNILGNNVEVGSAVNSHLVVPDIIPRLCVRMCVQSSSSFSNEEKTLLVNSINRAFYLSLSEATSVVDNMCLKAAYNKQCIDNGTYDNVQFERIYLDDSLLYGGVEVNYSAFDTLYDSLRNSVWHDSLIIADADNTNWTPDIGSEKAPFNAVYSRNIYTSNGRLQELTCYKIHAWGNGPSRGLTLCDGNYENQAYSAISGFQSGTNGQMKFHHYNAENNINYCVTSTGPNTTSESTAAATLVTLPQSSNTWTVGSSNFPLQAVYATNFYGNASTATTAITASSATTATTATSMLVYGKSSNQNCPLLFTETVNNSTSASSARLLYTDTANSLHYNPSTNTLTGDFFKGSPIIPYGVCSTASSAQAKAVTLDPAPPQITTGMIICVQFTYTNTASNPTLNINSLGAKDLFRTNVDKVGSTISTSWPSGGKVLLRFDGGGWTLVSTTNYESTVAGNTNIIPSADNTYNIGSTSYKWKNMYIAGGNSSHYIIVDNTGGEPTIRPETGNYCYLGTSSYYWYHGYFSKLFVGGNSPKLVPIPSSNSTVGTIQYLRITIPTGTTTGIISAGTIISSSSYTLYLTTQTPTTGSTLSFRLNGQPSGSWMLYNDIYYYNSGSSTLYAYVLAVKTA